MEIEGFTFLADLKSAIKKRLYRHVIIQVEKKFEKDYASLCTNHLLQILFKQIEAIHGLIEEVVSGKFDKNPDKIQKLIKIMNRNILVCADIFQSHMSRELMKTGASKSILPISQKPIIQMLWNFQQFISLVIDSCFYVYILRLISGVNAPQFELFSYQCKFILKHLFSSRQNDFKIRLRIGRIFLLLMGISIKNSNYTQAKQEFYQAISNILASLKVIQDKNNKFYEKQKRNTMLLVFVGLINYQRMLIQSDSFGSWEIGFLIMKEIEKSLKAEQSSWRKYIRIEYETRQILSSKKMEQVKFLFIPYLTEQSQSIRKIIVQAKNTKFVGIQLNSIIGITDPKRKLVQPKRTFYSTVKKVSNHGIDQEKQSKGYVITYNQSKSKKFIESLEKSYQIKGKENISLIEKKTLKKSKFPSIDWFSQSSSEILNAIFSNNAQSKVEQIKKQNELEQKQKNKQALKTEKKIKRSILFAKCSQSEQSFEFCKEKTKLKSKQYIIHRLISQQKEKKDEFSLKYEVDMLKKGDSITNQQQNDKQKKSIQINYTQTFIKLLIRSKRKLHLCSLVDKYELAKKKKKTRNYHMQILQFQLQKSIGNFLNPTYQTLRKSTVFGQSNFRKRNASITNIGLLSNINRSIQLKNQEIFKKQKQMAVAYSKSQEGIKQMLKKITANQQKYRTKRTPKKSKNYSELFLSYRPIE